MKVLSTNAIWAWAIFDGVRDVENRAFSTWERGSVLIHAQETMRETPFIRQWIRRNTLYLPPDDDWLIQEYVGRVIGEVDLIGCEPVDRLAESEREFASGPYCFRLRRPRPFVFPFLSPGCVDWSDVSLAPGNCDE